MDRNNWNRNEIEHRIDQWREQRAQKMAARLQLNSTKPRTISSNVLGYVNYRQPMTLQPGYRQQHGGGPRFNSHVDQRWNPNYNNYSGYREQHHSPHNQYHPADHRNHGGYNHGSYHQQHGQKKGGHFSSHNSLYNNRKSTGKPNKRFSTSCSNIDKTTEVENQNAVSASEQTSSIAIDNAVPSSSSSVEMNVNITECSENVDSVMEDVLKVEQEVVEKASDSDERFEECLEPESDRLEDITVEAVETLEISVIGENQLSEAQSHVDSCALPEGDVISDISVLEPAIDSSDVAPTLFVDASSTIAINIENSDDVTVVEAEAITELPVEVENDETSEQLDEPPLTDVTEKEPSEEAAVEMVHEPVVTIPGDTTYECTEAMNSTTIAYECTEAINSEIATNVEEVTVIEPVASSETNTDAANETLDLELNLSFKPEVEIIVEDTDEAVDPLQLNTNEETDSASNKGFGGSYAGTSHNENAGVFPVALIVAGDSDTEASIIRYEDISTESENDLSKEIERVEHKLANISIVNKEEVTGSEDCITPMKRERRQVLLDATNILPSSTIKFAVREVRKNDESEIIVTPVRRSARLSTLTPGSARRNICVQNLEELSPEMKQKMKFVKNPAIENPPEC